MAVVKRKILHPKCLEKVTDSKIIRQVQLAEKYAKTRRGSDKKSCDEAALDLEIFRLELRRRDPAKYRQI